MALLHNDCLRICLSQSGEIHQLQCGPPTYSSIHGVDSRLPGNNGTTTSSPHTSKTLNVMMFPVQHAAKQSSDQPCWIAVFMTCYLVVSLLTHSDQAGN